MRTLSKEQLTDIAYGGCFLASGGGGTIASTLPFLKGVADTATVTVATVEEAAAHPELMSAVAALAGVPSLINGATKPTPTIQAFQLVRALVKERTGKEVGYVMPAELGGLNSLGACLVALELGLPVIDADGAGRSVPQMTNTTWYGFQVSPRPTVLTSSSGCAVVIEDDSTENVDGMFRQVVVAPSFRGACGFAGWPMDSRQVRTAAPIRGTLQLAEDVGKVLRTSKRPVDDLEPVLASHGLRSVLLFEGAILRLENRVQAASDTGCLTFDDGARVVRGYYQNETMCLWDSTRTAPLAIAPDSICYLTGDGMPFSNNDVTPEMYGQKAFIFGIAAHECLTSNSRLRDSYSKCVLEMGYGGAYVAVGSSNP